MPGLEPFGIPSKGQGERPNPGSQFVFAALLDDFIGVCKGTEVVMPGIWWEWWVPAAQHPEQGFGVDLARARDEGAGPSPRQHGQAQCPRLCHHLLAKATRPSAGQRVLQNWLLHQPLELKALTNTGSLKIAISFARGGNTFPANAAGTAGRAYKK